MADSFSEQLFQVARDLSRHTDAPWARDISKRVEALAMQADRGVTPRSPDDRFHVGDYVLRGGDAANGRDRAAQAATVTYFLTLSDRLGIVVGVADDGKLTVAGTGDRAGKTVTGVPTSAIRHAEPHEIHAAVSLDRDARVLHDLASRGWTPAIGGDATPGQYTGAIIAVSQSHAYQDVGRQSYVKHDLSQLDIVPEISPNGRVAIIRYETDRAYENNRATLTEVASDTHELVAEQSV